MSARKCFSFLSTKKTQVLFFYLLLPLYTMAQSQIPLTQPPGTAQQNFALTQEVAQQPVGGNSPQRYLKSAAFVLAGPGLWTATYLYIDEPLQQLSQNHRNTLSNKVTYVLQPLGRQKYLMPVAGAALATGLFTKNEKLQKVGFISMGSILVNGTITNVLKKSFGRHRPSVSSENDRFEWPFQDTEHTSSPSSHTSTAFAVATSVATVYSDHKLVPPIAYGVATLVGLSRIHDNAHWATDVLKGAAVGYLSSRGVSYLYNFTEGRLSNRKLKLLITPQVSPLSAGFSSTLIF
jgi:membrane-associated phospholipid phosphatase